MMMRDSYTDRPEVFRPWLMGSQSEQKFQSLRSMTGTGMTKRLHKLAIMEDLQSQSD